MFTIRWPYQGFSNWPKGVRAAAAFSWDVDDEAPFYSRPAARRTEVSELEQRAYGVRRALPMIVDMLSDLKVPGAFYIPAYNAKRWANLFSDLDRAGFEIGGHGYLHEPVGGMSREEERSIVLKSRDVLEDIVGHKLAGYRTPAWQCNPWTLDILHEAGFVYDSSYMGDIAPYLVRLSEGGTMVEVPIHWYWDDVEYWGHTQATRNHVIAPPSTVLEIWKAELDAVVRAGGSFVLTLHPHVSGRPGLLAAVSEFIQYAKTIPGLWLTTPGNIAAHAAACHGMPTVSLADLDPDPRYGPTST